PSHTTPPPRAPLFPYTTLFRSPPEHAALAAEIAASGALASEHPSGSPSELGHFPRRNRIVAAFCRALVVVEAPEKSGALGTARIDRKSTRLNSSHQIISYAVFC